MKINQMVKALGGTMKNSKTSAYDTPAEVLRVDGSTVYVHIPGGVFETPVRKTINCQKGDTVQVRVGNGTAWLTGNATAPPTDDRLANRAVNEINKTNVVVSEATQQIANQAEQISSQAQQIAEQAESARIGAVRAQESADNAQADATKANTAANSALTQLGEVEKVMDMLSYIVEHGTYTLTTDTEINPEKSYFTKTGDVYTLVADPKTEELGTYYELSFDETLRNYVASHLALTDAGLYILKDNSAYKMLVANDHIEIQDPQGRPVITYGEDIIPDSSRPFRIGNNATFIKYYDSDGDGIPDKIAIIADSILFGSGVDVEETIKTTSERLSEVYDFEPEITYEADAAGSTGTMGDARILRAHVYQNGQDITDQIPDRFFDWYWVRESRAGRSDVLIGHGKSLEVDAEDAGLNGSIEGVFYPERDDMPLADASGKIILDKQGRVIIAAQSAI